MNPTDELKTVGCDLCGAVQDVTVFNKSAGEITYHIARCDNCGLVYVNPRRFQPEYEEYFRGPYLETIEDNGRLRDGIELIYSELIGYLETYLHPGRLLDVGCAMGHFLKFAQAHGWETVGTECSGYAAHWARERYLRVRHQCTLSHARFPPQYCDAAVLIEVIEHLPAPRETLLEVFRILKPGGVVCVTTPNFSSYRSLLMREEWAPIIPSGHLYYFTRATLERMLVSAGFTNVVELTKPGDFDADLDFAKSNHKLRADDVENIRLALLKEDAAKPSNGRGEGLVLCAEKPPGPGLSASKRTVHRARDLEGKLIQVVGGVENKVYYVFRGVRYWVRSQEWIARHGLRFPEDLLGVAFEDLAGLPEGFPL
jgi:2-polyprenyl-3-methyl-5-hydroxy-6-metoxy-1,4-benzoquinol methylase